MTLQIRTIWASVHCSLKVLVKFVHYGYYRKSSKHCTSSVSHSASASYGLEMRWAGGSFWSPQCIFSDPLPAFFFPPLPQPFDAGGRHSPWQWAAEESSGWGWWDAEGSRRGAGTAKDRKEEDWRRKPIWLTEEEEVGSAGREAGGHRCRRRSGEAEGVSEEAGGGFGGLALHCCSRFLGGFEFVPCCRVPLGLVQNAERVRPVLSVPLHPELGGPRRQPQELLKHYLQENNQNWSMSHLITSRTANFLSKSLMA